MSTSWYIFFRDLDLETGYLLRWYLSKGENFYMILPDKIDLTCTGYVGWSSVAFSDLVMVEVPKNLTHNNIRFDNDLVCFSESLPDVEGLEVVISEESIIISLAEAGRRPHTNAK